MTIRDISGWLLRNEGFLSHYRDLVIESALSQLGDTLVPLEFQRAGQNWDYLLTCATLLAGSDSGEAQAAALRIAQHCLASEVKEGRRASAALILESLLNYPAIRLAEERGLLRRDIESVLPFPARLDWVSRELESSLFLSDGSVLRANRFQGRFWEASGDHDWISVSAPTSAGKSFIIEHWVAEFIRINPAAMVVYIVPTRALISQVEADLVRFFVEAELKDVSVSSAPVQRALSQGQSNVFVFTQERLHVFLASFPEEPCIDALLIDEAHKVGDRHRGVLLQQVIERVSYTNPRVKLMFASPLAENPEALLADARPEVRCEHFVSEDVTVSQNLFWASQDWGRPKSWTVALCSPAEVLPIGRVVLQSTPAPESKRLPFFAYSVGGERPGNIIYVNGARDAERTADQLYDARGKAADIANDPRIDALIELVAKTIHPQFLLVKVLRRGIAYHYGNMPLLVRTEIERLFSENAVQYLVCTSTLVEGVNMACKNIFLRGPQKGRGNLMQPEDFWNLAGRAGRWGKEFQGNIFCVDAARADLWDGGRPPQSRVRYRIQRTTDAVLTEPDELIAFIREGTPRDIARRRPDLEYMVSYLISLHLRFGSILKSPWSARYARADLGALSMILDEIVPRLRTPAWVVLRNPGISPLAMDSLLEYLDARKDRIEELIPADPASDAAPDSYAAVFTRIYRTMSREFGPEGGRVYMLGLLVARWMRGYPLSRLITDRIAYHRRKKHNVSVAAAIRSVMEEVERIARFEAPKHLVCYSDLLRVVLEENGRSDLTPLLSDFSVLLEFGVSLQTQVSLVLLGLSRTSTVMLSELIAADDLTEVQALDWLRTNPWQASDLPILVKAEVEAVLARLQANGA